MNVTQKITFFCLYVLMGLLATHSLTGSSSSAQVQVNPRCFLCSTTHLQFTSSRLQLNTSSPSSSLLFSDRFFADTLHTFPATSPPLPITPIDVPIDTQNSTSWLIPSLHSGFMLVLSHVMVSSLWPESFDPTQVSTNWDQFKSSYQTVPVFDLREGFFEWDGDWWPINVIGHGLMGSEFYLHHRVANHSRGMSFLMAFTWSTLWEYGVESWYKPPSGIDLLWTPLGGALIGEGRYQLYRWAQSIRNQTLQQVLLVMIDPFGQFRRLVIGIKDPRE